MHSGWQTRLRRPGRGRPGHSCCGGLGRSAAGPSAPPQTENLARARAGYQFSKASRAPQALSLPSAAKAAAWCFARAGGRIQAGVVHLCAATRVVPHASPGGELLTELAGWAGRLSSLPPLSASPAIQGVHTGPCFWVCKLVLLSIVCHSDMLMWLHRRGTQQLWRA